MVTFFTAVLAASLAGMFLLLLIKRFEMASGHVFFGRLRPRTNSFFYRVLVFFERTLPVTLRYLVIMLVRMVRSSVQRSVAWVILHVERALEHVLHTVRERTAPPQNRGEVSSFLRAVGDHKRKLLHQHGMERAIVDER